MTTTLDVANRALQLIGTRTSISSAEFTNLGSNGQLGTSNEAQQVNMIIFLLRDDLIRLAPWDCARKYANLTYITSVPTTPENSISGPPFWQPGTPIPPWAYEYQYPPDCLRAVKILPQYTAQAGGVPIFPPGTATGAGNIGWAGPALKFKVSTDSFYNATAATVVAGGTGYAVNDLITLAQPTYTFTQNLTPPGITIPQTITMNVGAPAVLQVATITGGGQTGPVATVTVVNQIYQENVSPSVFNVGQPSFSGSYYQVQTNPVAQGFANGQNGEVSNGTGATFNLTFTSSPAQQRVVLCNQEDAILCYNCALPDPNVMDQLFIDAWVHLLGARLAFQISGNIQLANNLLGAANGMITQARAIDGNEGLTVNDVTPDWIRTRGSWGGPNWEYSPNLSFDWGSTYSPY